MEFRPDNSRQKSNESIAFAPRPPTEVRGGRVSMLVRRATEAQNNHSREYQHLFRRQKEIAEELFPKNDIVSYRYKLTPFYTDPSADFQTGTAPVVSGDARRPEGAETLFERKRRMRERASALRKDWDDKIPMQNHAMDLFGYNYFRVMHKGRKYRGAYDLATWDMSFKKMTVALKRVYKILRYCYTREKKLKIYENRVRIQLEVISMVVQTVSKWMGDEIAGLIAGGIAMAGRTFYSQRLNILVFLIVPGAILAKHKYWNGLLEKKDTKINKKVPI
jgi:hypothetical protein